MPVEDTPVHDRVKRTADHHPACYNKEEVHVLAGYWALNGWEEAESGLLRMTRTWVPHTMSRKCRQILDLPECSGCTAEKDHEYISKMRDLK